MQNMVFSLTITGFIAITFLHCYAPPKKGAGAAIAAPQRMKFRQSTFIEKVSPFFDLQKTPEFVDESSGPNFHRAADIYNALPLIDKKALEIICNDTLHCLFVLLTRFFIVKPTSDAGSFLQQILSPSRNVVKKLLSTADGVNPGVKIANFNKGIATLINQMKCSIEDFQESLGATYLTGLLTFSFKDDVLDRPVAMYLAMPEQVITQTPLMIAQIVQNRSKHVFEKNGDLIYASTDIPDDGGFVFFLTFRLPSGQQLRWQLKFVIEIQDNKPEIRLNLTSTSMLEWKDEKFIDGIFDYPDFFRGATLAKIGHKFEHEVLLNPATLEYENWLHEIFTHAAPYIAANMLAEFPTVSAAQNFLHSSAFERIQLSQTHLSREMTDLVIAVDILNRNFANVKAEELISMCFKKCFALTANAYFLFLLSGRQPTLFSDLLQESALDLATEKKLQQPRNLFNDSHRRISENIQLIFSYQERIILITKEIGEFNFKHAFAAADFLSKDPKTLFDGILRVFSNYPNENPLHGDCIVTNFKMKRIVDPVLSARIIDAVICATVELLQKYALNAAEQNVLTELLTRARTKMPKPKTGRRR